VTDGFFDGEVVGANDGETLGVLEGAAYSLQQIVSASLISTFPFSMYCQSFKDSG